MKARALIPLLLAAPVLAQVVPTTPTKFSKKLIGGGTGSADVSVTTPPQAERMVRMTSHIALSEARQWTSTDGRPLLGKLIAFEDLVTEVPQSQLAQAQMPKLTGKPTVVSAGTARLLVNQTAYVIPLAKLSESDRAFVEKIRLAVEQGTPAKGDQ